MFNQNEELPSNGIDSKIVQHDRSKSLLESWLNKLLKVEISDGRILIGTFLCTDRDMNIILGTCLEYVKEDKASDEESEEPRSLGLVMIPGKHIISIHLEVSPINLQEPN